MSPQPEQETGTDRLVLQIPPEAGFIAMARMFGASVARHFGCDEGAVEDVKIAISEACTNSVKAHHDVGSTDPIELSAHAIDDKLIFEIVDAGPGIDIERHLAPDETATPPGGLYEGSLGLTLIEALFPDAHIARNADRGTTVRFTLATGTALFEGIDQVPELS